MLIYSLHKIRVRGGPVSIEYMTDWLLYHFDQFEQNMSQSLCSVRILASVTWNNVILGQILVPNFPFQYKISQFGYFLSQKGRCLNVRKKFCCHAGREVHG
jgi:hypothetical protein